MWKIILAALDGSSRACEVQVLCSIDLKSDTKTDFGISLKSVFGTQCYTNGYTKKDKNLY